MRRKKKKKKKRTKCWWRKEVLMGAVANVMQVLDHASCLHTLLCFLAASCLPLFLSKLYTLDSRLVKKR